MENQFPEEKLYSMQLLACVAIVSVGFSAFFAVAARSKSEKTHKTPTETLASQAVRLCLFTLTKQ